MGWKCAGLWERTAVVALRNKLCGCSLKRRITRTKDQIFPGDQESLSRSTVPVKTLIFQSIAKQITPFLVQYQTDKPMLPFMSEDMYKLIRGNFCTRVCVSGFCVSTYTHIIYIYIYSKNWFDVATVKRIIHYFIRHYQPGFCGNTIRWHVFIEKTKIEMLSTI